MPSRNMIAANEAVFRTLDDYCSFRGDPIRNAGKARWMRTRSCDREFLKRAIVKHQISFSPTIKVMRLDWANKAHFFTAGFDVVMNASFCNVEDLHGGALTAFLYESQLRPTATTAEIRDVVEVADQVSDSQYDGHAPELISRLYSNIQVFSIKDLTEEESYKVFFLLCISDLGRVDWIDDQLASQLRTLSEMSAKAIPYETLCRSILDMDASSVFLSLYRCLEAQYAYSHTENLKAELGLQKPWSEVAAALERHLSWYPREEPSLEALLKCADDSVLQEVATSLGETVPSDARLDAFVAKRIYDLRNRVVHYRPLFQSGVFEGDWNRLCEAMAKLVFRIYETLERGTSTLVV